MGNKRASVCARSCGHSFSKEFTIASLQHLAKIICRSVGWPFGSDAVEICRVSEQLASRLLEHRAADNLLQSNCKALVNPTDGKDTFSELGKQLKKHPWFDTAGNLDKAALNRILPAFDEEERKHIKSKLQKVYRLVTQEDHKGPDWGNFMQCTSLCVWARSYAGAIRCRANQVLPGTFNFLQGTDTEFALPSAANGCPWENHHDQQ